MRALVGELVAVAVCDVVAGLGLTNATALALASAMRFGVEAAMGLELCGLVTGRSPSN